MLFNRGQNVTKMSHQSGFSITPCLCQRSGVMPKSGRCNLFSCVFMDSFEIVAPSHYQLVAHLSLFCFIIAYI
ncbi:hypothetical protein FKM82_006994 [Ascaphus truei]